MITGEITKILTQKDDDWGRYRIELPDGTEKLAVGVIPQASIGMTVTMEGADAVTKYGRQYTIKEVLSATASPLAGARRFLTDGYIKGIGPAKADAILSKFGKEGVDLFDTESGRRRLAIAKGLSEKLIASMMPSYEENKKYKPIVLFLNGAGTKGQVEKIYEEYGDGAVGVLKSNPYRLQLDLDGFGFRKADAIAMASGVKPDSKYRLMAAIKSVIEEAESVGNCYLRVDEAKNAVCELLAPMPHFDDVGDKAVRNATSSWSTEAREKLIKAHSPSMETLDKIGEVMETRRLISEGYSDALGDAIQDGILKNDDGRIYTKSMYETEESVAKMLSDMASSNPVRYVKPETIESAIRAVEDRKTDVLRQNGVGGRFSITKEQRDAVYRSAMHRVSIISGGPGRGKTAISEIVAEAFMMSGFTQGPDDVIMLAPTGRAAQRLTESTGHPAMTAHRAILSSKTGGSRPKRKLVIVDESSMADIYLMNGILKYASGCNLIFMGDVDQIASVGPGKCLHDMISSGAIPCTMLKEGHRNTGTIAQNSVLINAGMKLKDYSYDEHFKYVPSDKDHIQEDMIRGYMECVGKYGIENVMLCTAMRERGPIAVRTLNGILQEKVTAGHPSLKFPDGRTYRAGDRVMQTRNDYSFKIKRNGVLMDGVFNGEKGTVAKVWMDGEEYRMIVRFDDGSLGGYTDATEPELTLAYATTLHKCQGSEAPCMIMGYTFGDYMLLNRSLFYTGETRAKDLFLFYGEEKDYYGRPYSAFDLAVSRADDQHRNTALAERIREYADNAGSRPGAD